MPDQNAPSATEYVLEKIRAGETPYGIAAASYGEVSSPDLDGVAWLVLVTDGSTTAEITVTLSGSRGGSPGMAVSRASVEAAVERRGGRYDVRSRLADLVADAPVALASPDELDA